MEEPMEIVGMSPINIGSTLKLCAKLKAKDNHPCSYWGYSQKGLENSLQRKDQTTLICINDENEVVGIGTLTKGGPFQDHWAEIGVAIHPDCRSSGLAQRMVMSLEEYVEEMKIEFIKALILENNHPSRRFFEKLGYEHKTTLFQDFKIDGFGNLNDCGYYKMFSDFKKCY